MTNALRSVLVRIGSGSVALFVLTACASQPATTVTAVSLPAPVSLQSTATFEYRISPGDKISIRVFQVPDLSFDKISVDASGKVLMPLIGSVTVAGKTPQEVSNDIATRLSVKYLQSPQVAVVVDQAAVQKVTVEGAVTQSGVFELSGNTTLLQAVAMAKGPNKTADLQNVIIFRTIDGKRQAARFDLTAIRSGAVPDVDVFGNDVVVLTDSGPKSMFRDIISSLPALGVFAYF